MKKYLVLIAAAITLGFTSCGEEDCNHAGEGKNTIGYSEITGSWYDPIENEEVKYTENGTFHDKYANKNKAAVTEGRYEINANKLTYSYQFMGQYQYSDFTLSNYLPDLTVTLYSKKTGKTVLYKITESISLALGETATLPSYGLESPDKRIVTVDGLQVKSMGMKGTVYLKNSNETYVKVVVGDDTNDLWMDYSQLIGCTVGAMKNLLGRNPSSLSETDAFYNEVGKTHDLISYVGFQLDNEIITGITLFFKDGVNPTEIQQYLSSRYFYDSTMNMYTSHQTLASSIFVAQFFSDSNSLTFMKRPANIEDFTHLFVMPKNTIKNIFVNTEITAEANDSVRFSLESHSDFDLDYVTFYFRGKGKLMNSYAVHHKENVSSDNVSKVLRTKYTYLQEQDVLGKKAEIYSNKSFSITVLYYPSLRRIEYYDASQEEVSNFSTTADYIDVLGMSKDDFVKKYPGGNEYKNLLYFGLNSNIANRIYFRISDTSIIDCYFLTLKDETDIKQLKKELSLQFYFLNSDDSKKQTLWINTPNRTNATIGIQLYENDKQLYFFYL